jgi:transposase-like protein
MFGRETRMLLRYYLEQGASKGALARRLGLSPDAIHRWIRDGDLDRDLDATSVHYGPRPPIATKLDRGFPLALPAAPNYARDVR